MAIDKEVKRKIIDARKMIENVFQLDGNEAETRRRVERIFETVMGYNAFEHLNRERAVKGAGETEHVDFVVQFDRSPDAEPVIIVELKRVGIDLAIKHLKQSTSYAIDSGCEWVLLTNGRDWKLYHVEFGQPPITKLIEQWNLMTDDVSILARKFEIISYKNIKKGRLEKLWEKASVLSPANLLTAITSPESMGILRRILKKNSDVVVDYADLVTGLQKLLNESAAIELSKIKIRFPERKKKTKVKPENIPEQAIASTPVDNTDEETTDIQTG
jgi:predicted type IV restriction endonuclease